MYVQCTKTREFGLSAREFCLRDLGHTGEHRFGMDPESKIPNISNQELREDRIELLRLLADVRSFVSDHALKTRIDKFLEGWVCS